jgi:predicted transport protein
MSFQAYLDNIKAQTGKTPEDFLALAEKKGYLKEGVKTGEIVAWLKDDFGLGRGHAMAIVLTFQNATRPRESKDTRIAKLFQGEKAKWRETYDGLLAKLNRFGPDISVAPTNSYISLLRGSKKFAILQITKDRLDIGVKLKGANTTRRLEPASEWNSMVTHRVRISDPQQIDPEVLGWLKQAYEEVRPKGS